MRIDKLLWFLRFARTRPLAQGLAETGYVRLNGRRVERSAQRVAVGDVLVLPLPAGVRVVKITGLPTRRGPASEAQQCYRTLDAAGSNCIAASPTTPFGNEHQGDSSP